MCQKAPVWAAFENSSFHRASMSEIVVFLRVTSRAAEHVWTSSCVWFWAHNEQMVENADNIYLILKLFLKDQRCDCFLFVSFFFVFFLNHVDLGPVLRFS